MYIILGSTPPKLALGCGPKPLQNKKAEFHGLGRRYHAGADLLAWCEQMEIKPPPDEELASVLRPAFDRNSPYLMGAAYTDW